MPPSGSSLLLSRGSENGRYSQPLIECFGRSVPSLAQLARPAALRSGRYRGALGRERFRHFWARLFPTNRRGRGRAGTGVEIRRLIERMASANPLWWTPRLHGELQMLGIQISERTVARILGRLRRPPSQT